MMNHILEVVIVVLVHQVKGYVVALSTMCAEPSVPKLPECLMGTQQGILICLEA